MARMVQVATAGDVTEAEELQELLRDAGIDAEIEPLADEDGLSVLVPESRDRGRSGRHRGAERARRHHRRAVSGKCCVRWRPDAPLRSSLMIRYGRDAGGVGRPIF